MNAKPTLKKVTGYLKDRFTKEFFSTYGGVLLALCYGLGWLTKDQFEIVGKLLEQTGTIAPGLVSAALILLPEPKLTAKNNNKKGNA